MKLVRLVVEEYCRTLHIIGTFRLDYEYEIEYESEFRISN